MKKIFGMAILLILISLGSNVYAGTCFIATGKAMSDAQTIRKQAKSMGWKVGKAASLTAGSLIKGKAKLYPQESVEVCLKVNGEGSLMFKAQSSSPDAGDAVWRNLFGHRL